MKKLLTGLAVLSVFGISAQSASPDVISSAGNDFSNANLQVSWTMGEPIITTITDGNSILTQGFHQSHLSSVSILDLNSTIVFEAFPNPVIHELIIENSDEAIGHMMQINDRNGREIWSSAVTKNKETIDFSSYASGTYFLSLSKDGSAIKTFKILKTN